jgi:GNAT superfamily N-acetyltransferase
MTQDRSTGNRRGTGISAGRVSIFRAAYNYDVVMVDFVIREGRSDELAVVVYHRRRMFEEMGYTDVQQLAALDRSSEEFFGPALAAGTYRAWFVEVEGAVIAGGGVLILPFQPGPLDPRPERPWIVNVFTEPAYRRKGLARILMTEMVEWCRAQGFTVVSLHASDAGRPVYDGMGFLPTNEMRLRLG